MLGRPGLSYKGLRHGEKALRPRIKQIELLNGLIKEIEAGIKNTEDISGEIPPIAVPTKLSGTIMDGVFNLIYTRSGIG